MVKSPPEIKKKLRDESKHKLPPLPRTRKSQTARPQKSRSVIARRVSSLPKPIQQNRRRETKVRDAETQTEEIEEPRRGVNDDILADIRFCGDLLHEMICSACELSEIYQKERKRDLMRRSTSCCIVM